MNSKYSKGVSSILLLILLGSLLVFGYFVQTGRIDRNFFRRLTDPYCNVPIKINLGKIDSRFKLKNETILKELEDASRVWEDESGKDLFVFDGKNKSTITVNFIYDERQEEALASAKALEELKAKWRTYESSVLTLKSLARRYDSLKNEYESDQVAYERRLNDYEARVRAWNRNPGDASEYEALRKEEVAMKGAYNNLEKERRELNGLVDQVNSQNDQVQNLYIELSKETKIYNQQFASDEQITVGEYDGNYDINIYQYTDLDQLKVTLAHEIGHSLGMEHTQNPLSIMYPLQTNQSGDNLVLTAEDIEEFKRVCGTKI